MIEMANNEMPVSDVREEVQERHGIPATGNADEITAPGRKSRDDIFRQRKLHALSRPFMPNRVKPSASVGRRRIF
jgi:hypothetical protein